ncbi:MAG: hypothetical protein ACHP7H_01280 [Hyphomicrobiales bacterium]
MSALALLLTVALAVSLTGCGGSSGNGIASKTPTEILAASKAAADSATSVHVAGKSSQGPLSLTLNLDLASNGGRGQISGLGLAYEVIRVGDTLYAKGNHAFYTRLSATTGLHLPQGVWLKAPASGGKLAQLASFTNLSRELGRLLSSTGPVTKGATTTVNGQKAIELKESAKLFSGSLFIATTGKPYPVELLKRGRESGQTTFSGWNAPVSLTAPANAIAIQ